MRDLSRRSHCKGRSTRHVAFYCHEGSNIDVALAVAADCFAVQINFWPVAQGNLGVSRRGRNASFFAFGFPRASMSSLHRSKTGIISPWVRHVISDLCLLFDLVPETRALGRQRPTELNFEGGGPTMSGIRSQSRCFLVESTCDVGSALASDSKFQCHLCGDWFSSSCPLQWRQLVCQRMWLLT